VISDGQVELGTQHQDRAEPASRKVRPTRARHELDIIPTIKETANPRLSRRANAPERTQPVKGGVLVFFDIGRSMDSTHRAGRGVFSAAKTSSSPCTFYFHNCLL